MKEFSFKKMNDVETFLVYFRKKIIGINFNEKATKNDLLVTLIDFYEELLNLRKNSYLVSAFLFQKYELLEKKIKKEDFLKESVLKEFKKKLARKDISPRYFERKFRFKFPDEIKQEGLFCNLSDIYNGLSKCLFLIREINSHGSLNSNKNKNEIIFSVYSELDYHLLSSHLNDYFVVNFESGENFIHGKSIFSNISSLLDYISKGKN